MIIFNKSEILQAISISKVFEKIEQGFCQYSQGKVVVPPVGHMHFQEPSGDLHIKYGHIPGEPYYVVKIASHFAKNSEKGLSAIQGMMCLFSQKTGKPVAFLLDEGYLTHLRTAVAGAICAKYLGPQGAYNIGIVGAGMQARMQLKLLSYVTDNRNVFVWSRDYAEAEKFKADSNLSDFNVQISPTLDDLAAQCKLIVTTTSSQVALLKKHQITAGTHITAVGADRPGKQELDASVFELATRVTVDSRSQCFAFGDTSYALKANASIEQKIFELGEIICNTTLHRQSNQEITIADLTGLAVQDLKVAEAAFESLSATSEV